MSSSKEKVAVAVHTYGHIEPAAYANHIAVFSDWAKNYNIVFMTLDGAKVAEARNILVDKAIEMNCTHILFVDADHIIDSSMLPCLLGNTDAAAVSGVVTKRSGDGPQVGFIKADEDYSYTVQLPLDGISYEVDSCAFGCTLIDLSVFKDIEKPYFKDTTPRNKNGKLYSRRSDMQFCRELRGLGKIIRIDTRVVVGHIGKPQIFYPKNRVFQLNTYLEAARIIKDNSYTSMIDLGCGFGSKLIDYIKPVCKNITAVDVNDAIDLCKTRDKDINWVCWNLNEKYFSAAKYDLVLCADVLEHLDNLDNAMSTIKNCIKPDGVAVLSTPDVSTVAKDILVNSEHKNFWTEKQFKEFVKSCGFEIIKCDRYDEIINYKSIVVVCRLKGE